MFVYVAMKPVKMCRPGCMLRGSFFTLTYGHVKCFVCHVLPTSGGTQGVYLLGMKKCASVW